MDVDIYYIESDILLLTYTVAGPRPSVVMSLLGARRSSISSLQAIVRDSPVRLT